MIPKINPFFDHHRRLRLVILVSVSVFAVGLIYVQFMYNVFSHGMPGQFEIFQDDSEALVINKIAKSKTNPIFSDGGFLLRRDGIYSASPGLQGMIFSAIIKWSPIPLGSVEQVLTWDRVELTATDLSTLTFNFLVHRPLMTIEILHEINFFRHLSALFSTIVFFLLLWAVRREFGWIAAAVLWVGVLWSPWLTMFGRNLFWLLGLLLLPYVVSWLVYEPLRRRQALCWFYALIGLIVFLKSMTGYEYISNIIASAAVPLLLVELKMKSPLRLILKRLVMTGIAGGVGFAFAIGAHLVQGFLLTGQWSEAADFILSRFLVRTYFYEGGEEVYRQVSNKSLWMILQDYFSLQALQSYPKFFSVSFRWLINAFLAWGVAMALWRWRRKMWRQDLSVIDRLWIVTAYSLLASLSWAVLARGHMYFHLHINAMIFYLPFVLTLFVLIGTGLNRLVCYCLWRWDLGPWFIEQRHYMRSFERPGDPSMNEVDNEKFL